MVNRIRISLSLFNISSSGQGVTTDQWNNKTNSTMSKMEHTFWVTKQSVFRKFGKKEDECIVASDAELDAKLELFRSVQDTCSELQRILDKYQERLCSKCNIITIHHFHLITF